MPYVTAQKNYDHHCCQNRPRNVQSSTGTEKAVTMRSSLKPKQHTKYDRSSLLLLILIFSKKCQINCNICTKTPLIYSEC